MHIALQDRKPLSTQHPACGEPASDASMTLDKIREGPPAPISREPKLSTTNPASRPSTIRTAGKPRPNPAARTQRPLRNPRSRHPADVKATSIAVAPQDEARITRLGREVATMQANASLPAKTAEDSDVFHLSQKDRRLIIDEAELTLHMLRSGLGSPGPQASRKKSVQSAVVAAMTPLPKLRYSREEAAGETTPLVKTAKKATENKSGKTRKRRARPAYDPASPFPQMVDAKVVAAALNCSIPHVYALAASGRLTHSLFEGRVQFSVDDINDYLRDHKVA